MAQSSTNEMNTLVETTVKFGAAELKANAALYREHGKMVDAASRYDSIDDAIAGLKSAWEVLETQIENGAGYTPDKTLNFGSDDAKVIAESLLGRRNSVGATRQSFKTLGKK
jgi:hypothetical protein